MMKNTFEFKLLWNDSGLKKALLKCNYAHFIVNLDFFLVTVASILQPSADVSG
jgi:hypothetical protein